MINSHLNRQHKPDSEFEKEMEQNDQRWKENMSGGGREVGGGSWGGYGQATLMELSKNKQMIFKIKS